MKTAGEYLTSILRISNYFPDLKEETAGSTDTSVVSISIHYEAHNTLQQKRLAVKPLALP
jgi:hypothetical protein